VLLSAAMLSLARVGVGRQNATSPQAPNTLFKGINRLGFFAILYERENKDVITRTR
jgi:hypothetical protein